MNIQEKEEMRGCGEQREVKEKEDRDVMAEYFYMICNGRKGNSNHKNGREANALEKYAKAHCLQFDQHNIYKENYCDRDNWNRPEWNKLERILRDGDVVIFKDISIFVHDVDISCEKYMQLINNGVELIFLDNPTMCTGYIKQFVKVAENQRVLNGINIKEAIKLLLGVEMDRSEQEKQIRSERIKDGMDVSDKKPGRKVGKVDKLSEELKKDIIIYLEDGSLLPVEIMRKHHISRNTLKKYIKLVNEREAD